MTRSIVLGLLGLAVAFSFYGTVNKPDCGDLDFGAYYRASEVVRNGETPYQVDEHGPMGVYPYAPAYAFLLTPLNYLDYPWAFRAWLGLNWVATIAAFHISQKLLDENSKDRWGVLLLAGVPVLAYVWANLRVGQAGMFVLLACLGWAWYQRRGRPFVGGLLLAAAVAVKLAPMVLVPWLILRRDWRGLAGVLAGLVVVFLLPLPWVGVGEAAHLHIEWARHTIATHVPIQTYRPGNQSLLAMLARLPAIGNGHVCYSQENLERLFHTYPLILAALSLGLYAVLSWRRPVVQVARLHEFNAGEPPALRGWPIDNESLALLLVFMTLAHPRAWRCNYVALLFPCLLLAGRVVRREPGWKVALGGLAALLLAAVWPTNGVGEGGWSLPAWLLLGKHFWAGLAVAGACLITQRSPNQAGVTSQTSVPVPLPGPSGQVIEAAPALARSSCAFRLPMSQAANSHWSG